MAKYELTNAADRDLTNIYSYTVEQFGEQQADSYLMELDDCFNTLAEKPKLGRSAERLRPGYRRFEHRSHVVFFTEIPGGIRIVRVLHNRMDVPRHL